MALEAVIFGFGEPERPFRVLRGGAHGKRWADPGLLRAWHAEALKGGNDVLS